MPISKFFCPGEGASPKRERRKDARPGELLDAALDLFVEKGFAATRAEEVAAKAGVSKGTVFLYFQSKEELFKAVIRENLSGRFKEWEAEFQSFEGSTPEMLRYCLRSWWERVGATKVSGITKIMVCEGSNFPEITDFYQKEVILPGQTLIRRILQRGVDRKEFRAVNVDYAAFSISSAMLFLILSKHSVNMCVRSDMQLDPEQYINSQADIILNGLCLAHGVPS